MSTALSSMSKCDSDISVEFFKFFFFFALAAPQALRHLVPLYTKEEHLYDISHQNNLGGSIALWVRGKKRDFVVNCLFTTVPMVLYLYYNQIGFTIFRCVRYRHNINKRISKWISTNAQVDWYRDDMFKSSEYRWHNKCVYLNVAAHHTPEMLLDSKGVSSTAGMHHSFNILFFVF